MKEKLQAALARLTADKKKFGLMCTLIAVGLLLWGRLILLDRVPKTAVADPESEQTAQAEPPPGLTQPQSAVYIGRLPEDAARDLFAIPRDRYRPVPRPDKRGNSGNPGSGQADAPPADLSEVRDAARRLRLQSVIHGIRPRIVMNDQMLQTGDMFEGFKVLAIEPHSAIVAKDGYLFRLRVTTR